MEIGSSYTQGLHKAGEDMAVWMSLNKQPDGTSRIMAIGLPHTAVPGGYFAVEGISDEPRYPAEAGYTVVMPAAIPHMMGNEAAIDSLDKAIIYARTNLGASEDPVFLLGMSMGGLLVCNWARQNLSDVAAIAMITPALDLEFVRSVSAHYDGDVISAYGGAGPYAAARPTHNPVEYADELEDIPICIWYSSDDTLAPLSMMVPFANLHGHTKLIGVGAQGHNPSAALGQDILAFYNDNL